MLTGPVPDFKAFRNELMPGRKGRLTGRKLAKEELEDEKVNNPKSYWKIINNWAIRNPALQINIENFDIKTGYKYAPKKIQQAAGYTSNKAKEKAGEIKDDESEPEEEDDDKDKSNNKMAGKRLPKPKVATEQADNPFSKEALGIGKEIAADEDDPFQDFVQKTQKPESVQDDDKPYTSAASLKTPKKKMKNVVLSKRKPDTDDEDEVAFLENFEKREVKTDIPKKPGFLKVTAEAIKAGTTAGLQEYQTKRTLLDQATWIEDNVLKLLPLLQNLGIKSKNPAMEELQNACSALYKKTKAHTTKATELRDNKDVLKVKVNYLAKLTELGLDEQASKIKRLTKSDLSKFQ